MLSFMAGIGNQQPVSKIRPANYFLLAHENKKSHRIHYQYNKVIQCKESKHFLLKQVSIFIEENQFH